MQLSLFPRTPVSSRVRPPRARLSSRAETRIKILAGVVVLGQVRREAGAAQAFLEAVEASSLTSRDRASVKAYVAEETVP